MLAILTLAHPLVDACSVCVAISGGLTPGRILAYNAIAFAGQLPLGILADARPGAARPLAILGMALAAGAAVAAACGAGGWGALVAACAGNAMFHLGAGKRILDATSGRGGPIGLFISTGALGLLAGRLLTERAGWAAPLSFAAALACVAVAGAAIMDDGRRQAPAGPAPASFTAALGLFALVAWRSWAGLAAGRMSQGAAESMILVAAFATWAGKAIGGFAGDRHGHTPVVLASVACSAILAFFFESGSAGVWLPLVFMSQLATGPVLSALHGAVGRRSGTAFGLNCMALFAGSLP